MTGIISINSHVVYGYVGNKAASFPLQIMGYDVWQINTVQFSNHPGYGLFKGNIFSKNHINSLIKGIIELNVIKDSRAVLSGYIGKYSIGKTIIQNIKRIKSINPDVIYLCDPVMGDYDKNIFVEDEVINFFKEYLYYADIITPNQFEAELLTGIKINTSDDLKKTADYFHNLGIKIVVITSVNLVSFDKNKNKTFISSECIRVIAYTPYYKLNPSVKGTGDLFAALFLGYYLKNIDILSAFKKTLHQMDLITCATYNKRSKELQILTINCNPCIKKFNFELIPI